ncbi:MAG TPA: hypothetical protein VK041_05765 [Opitutales bacterium]|nr:hypothetical protein [Opitutales bacterium]
MNLTNEQKAKIAEWVAQELNLSQIQQKLSEEFDLKLTYMDTRFLIDDLDLTLAEQRPAQPETPIDELSTDDQGTGGVTVEVDKIVQPGAVASGTATFSDGKTSRWAVDTQGRLILEAAAEGYQPSQEDIENFQQELAQALQGPGAI